MIAIITAIFDGIGGILAQPGATAIIASIIGFGGSTVVSRYSERRAERRAHLEYLRRRHDQFDTILTTFIAQAGEWEDGEHGLLDESHPGGPHDAAPPSLSWEELEGLRQQVARTLVQLAAHAPSDALNTLVVDLHDQAHECYVARQAVVHRHIDKDETVGQIGRASEALGLFNQQLWGLIEANRIEAQRSPKS